MTEFMNPIFLHFILHNVATATVRSAVVPDRMAAAATRALHGAKSGAQIQPTPLQETQTQTVFRAIYFPYQAHYPLTLAPKGGSI